MRFTASALNEPQKFYRSRKFLPDIEKQNVCCWGHGFCYGLSVKLAEETTIRSFFENQEKSCQKKYKQMEEKPSTHILERLLLEF